MHHAFLSPYPTAKREGEENQRIASLSPCPSLLTRLSPIRSNTVEPEPWPVAPKTWIESHELYAARQPRNDSLPPKCSTCSVSSILPTNLHYAWAHDLLSGAATARLVLPNRGFSNCEMRLQRVETGGHSPDQVFRARGRSEAVGGDNCSK